MHVCYLLLPFTDPDQGMEWVNSTGKKKRGGIIGITKTISALLFLRWTLSYNLRSDIANQTHKMFYTTPGSTKHQESHSAGQKRDNDDEKALVSAFRDCKVFVSDTSDTLKNIVSKDLASDAIQQSFLQANELAA